MIMIEYNGSVLHSIVLENADQLSKIMPFLFIYVLTIQIYFQIQYKLAFFYFSFKYNESEF